MICRDHECERSKLGCCVADDDSGVAMPTGVISLAKLKLESLDAELVLGHQDFLL